MWVTLYRRAEPFVTAALIVRFSCGRLPLLQVKRLPMESSRQTRAAKGLRNTDADRLRPSSNPNLAVHMFAPCRLNVIASSAKVEAHMDARTIAYYDHLTT